MIGGGGKGHEVSFVPTGAVLGSWGRRGDEERGSQDPGNGQ